MAGLTSSVTSAVSELSVYSVDLGSSVHSNMAFHRPSTPPHSGGKSVTLRDVYFRSEVWRKEPQDSGWIEAGGSSHACRPTDSGVPQCPNMPVEAGEAK